MSNIASGLSNRWITTSLIYTLILSLLLSLALPVPHAFATTQTTESAPVITLDERFLNNAPRRERGRCTDVYSKAWCDAHGYKNNRPVGKVVLNKKELSCLLKFYGSVSAALAAGLVTMNAAGTVVASAGAAYRLWRCIG